MDGCIDRGVAAMKNLFFIFITLFICIPLTHAFAADDAPGCELKERAQIDVKLYVINADPTQAIAKIDEQLTRVMDIADKISSSNYVVKAAGYDLDRSKISRKAVGDAEAWEAMGDVALEVESLKIGKDLLVALAKENFDTDLNVDTRRDSACRLKRR